MQIVFPKLISNYAKQNLLYLLGFHYWHAGPSFYTKRTAFPCYLFCYTVSGCGVLEYGGNSYELKKGDGFLIDGKLPHSYRTRGNDWECIFLTFNGPGMSYRYQLFSQSGNACFHQSLNGMLPSELTALAQIFDNNESIMQEYLISHKLDDILILLLQERMVSKKGSNKEIDHIAGYIQRHYAENLTLDQLAAKSSLSKYHLCKLFKATMNMTINDYVTHVRVQAAMDMLANTNLPANKIAHKVGLDNENYFYRLFKKETGLTPKEYKISLLHGSLEP